MKPRVRFDFQFNYESAGQKEKYDRLYFDKFSALNREVRRRKYIPADYAALPAIRELLSQYSNVNDLIPVLGEHLSGSDLLRLTEIIPLFKLAPLDHQAFLLLGLGLRVHQKEKTHEETTAD